MDGRSAGGRLLLRATGARAWERRTWGHESAPWCKAAKTGTGAAGGLGGVVAGGRGRDSDSDDGGH